MVRHATSHGFAVLVCTITASLLIDLIRDRVPKLINVVEGISDRIILLMNLPFRAEYLSPIIFASMLAFIWGAFFKLSRNKSY